jgi:hypothetical protein
MPHPDQAWTSLPFSGTGSSDQVTTFGFSCSNNNDFAIGNGTIALRVRRTAGVAYFEFYLLAGSTTFFGSGGATRFSIPWPYWVVTALLVNPAGGWGFAAAAYAFDASGTTPHAGSALVSNGGIAVDAGADIVFGTTTMTPTAPFTWTTGARLMVTGCAEAVAT